MKMEALVGTKEFLQSSKRSRTFTNKIVGSIRHPLGDTRFTPLGGNKL